MESQSEPLRCVMCNKIASWIDIRTEEALCDECVQNNNEAYAKKKQLISLLGYVLI